MIRQFQSISPRRKIVALAMAALVAVGGIASWAAVTDQLTQTNNLSVLSVDIQGSKDGTTYTQTLAVDWTVQGTANNYKAVQIKNAGNGQASIRFVASATGDAQLTAGTFRIYSGVTQAACEAGSVTGGTILNNDAAASETIATASSTGGAGDIALVLAPGAVGNLCMSANYAGALTAGTTATQTLAWTSTGG